MSASHSRWTEAKGEGNFIKVGLQGLWYQWLSERKIQEKRLRMPVQNRYKATLDQSS